MDDNIQSFLHKITIFDQLLDSKQLVNFLNSNPINFVNKRLKSSIPLISKMI